MKDLRIQIQPNRAPGLDMPAVKALCGSLAAKDALVSRFEIDDQQATYDCINVTFATPDPAGLWTEIGRALYMHPDFGLALRAASIVVCQGDRGWDDYLLLHHFDSEQKLDRFGGRAG